MREERHTLFEILDIATGEGDANFVEFCGGQGSTGRVIFFFALSDVTHRRDRGDCKGGQAESYNIVDPVYSPFKASMIDQH